jgi:predicted DNA-binding transcriptional regulator
MTLLSGFIYAIIGITLGVVVTQTVRSFLMFKRLKKFVAEIQREMTIELSYTYFLLTQGKIGIIDFYEKQEWVGRLYSKIFEDYKKSECFKRENSKWVKK